VDGSPSGEDAGAAYVFRRTNDAWTEEARLAVEDDDSVPGFGQAVALSDGTAVVGAPGGEESQNERASSVHVFQKADGRWSREATLVADGSDSNSAFGRGVALSGDTVLVGAPEETNQNGERAGSAYVFQRSDEGWTRQTTLLPEDSSELDRFGYSVSLVGDTALVSAIGFAVIPGPVRAESSAYVFERTDDRWTEAATLVPDGGTVRGFGRSVDLTDGTALIGAFEPSDEAGRNSTAAAYVFERSSRAWEQGAKLEQDSGEQDDDFGRRVALSENRALVGAPDTDEYISTSGTAHLFEQESDRWIRSTVFDVDSRSEDTPVGGAMADFFGRSVALDTDTALVGGTVDEGGQTDGAVYGFSLPA